MRGKAWIRALAALALLTLIPCPGARAKKTAAQIKTILPTWLCAGEETPARERPEDGAPAVWTLETGRMYRTDRHADQYYLVTSDDGLTGYVDKGTVRILNAADLTAGKMFRLPHVAKNRRRLPVEYMMSPGVITGETAFFLPEEEREETLPAGTRAYLFTAYGGYAAVWAKGRLGYVARADAAPLRDETAEAYRENLETETGTIRPDPVLTEAFSMLEEGNPVALRYGKLTGERAEPLFSAGVPYFWGGKEEKILLERWPAYTTRKQWQGTHDFYQKDSLYVYGLDCVGYVTTVYGRAGVPLPDTLNALGSRDSCRAGNHLFCSAERPFPEDWREAAAEMRPGDLLALHHPGRHAMIFIGTLRDYGYTEEQLPALAAYLDYPLMIHSGENPQAYQRFDCLTARTDDSRVSKALGSDGGVSLCLLGVPREAAETVTVCHDRTYYCFDVEGACVTVMNFGNVRDYYVYRPGNAGE